MMSMLSLEILVKPQLKMSNISKQIALQDGGGVNLVAYCGFKATVIIQHHEILIKVKCFQAIWRSIVCNSERDDAHACIV